MKRIIILTLCVSILLPCSFTISAQSGWTEEDAWATGYLIGTGLRKIGERIDERREEERIRKEEQRANEEAARRQAEEEKRRNIENKKIESEKQLQQLRESNSPYADCYWINAYGELVQDAACIEKKALAAELQHELSMKYVDLGLPSGTLWGEHPMIFEYTYDEAIKKFGSKLPTKEQMEELKQYCTWSWDSSGLICQIIGPNGQSIQNYRGGYRECDDGKYSMLKAHFLWTSTTMDSNEAYCLLSNLDHTFCVSFSKCRKLPIRIVQNNPSKHTNYNQDGNNSVRSGQSKSSKYVDLGLPSGTLWKDSNEGGDHVHYTYDEAISQFGNKLPSKQQLEELKDKCTWIRKDNECIVVGPNGNSITLPAAGHRCCGGRGVVDLGEAQYWSSTPYDSDHAWSLYCMSSGFNRMFGEPYCYGLSVRLVQ